MKAKFFLPLFFLAHFSQAQIITNGDFENWAVDTSGYLSPVGWFSNNTSVLPALVVQGPGRTGNYSANFLINIPGEPFGYCDLGRIQFNYTGNIWVQNLSGYWRGGSFSIEPKLVVKITAYDSLYNNIGGGQVDYSTDSISPIWTAFNIDTVHYSSGIPYLTTISIELGECSPPGSVDDLVMTYITSTDEIQTISLLGTPLTRDISGNYFLDLNLLSPSKFTLNIFSVDGKGISEKTYSLQSGQQQIPIGTDNLKSGIYFCRFSGNGINKFYRLVKL